MTLRPIRTCFPLRPPQMLAGITGVAVGAWLGFSLLGWSLHAAQESRTPLTSSKSPAAPRNPALSSTAIPFGRAS